MNCAEVDLADVVSAVIRECSACGRDGAYDSVNPKVDRAMLNVICPFRCMDDESRKILNEKCYLQPGIP